MFHRFGTPRQAEIGLAILRVVTGIVFAAHGYMKFFGMGIGGTTGFFSQLGIPLPGIMSPFIATLELVGGTALALGLLTRVFATLLIFDMAGAIVFFHAKNGFFLPTGIEFVLMLMVSSMAHALAGARALSVDSMFGRSSERP
jgi:putative oxidoreductase